MTELRECPNCAHPLAGGGAVCGNCGYDPGRPPDDRGLEAEELRGVSAEGGRHLHPLAPLVFAGTGTAAGFLAAYLFGPELGVALGLLGGGLGVWMVERGRRLR